MHYVNGQIWVNNHAHVLQAKSTKADNRFLSYVISQADIGSVLVGGGRAKLNANVLMNIDLILPTKREQKKIGSYLKSIDQLITLHQCKMNQAKTLKKYFLQNMFPAEGETVPKIRLKDFKGYWKNRSWEMYSKVYIMVRLLRALMARFGMEI